MSAGCLDDQTALAFLDGALPAERRIAVELHIDGCEACRRLLGILAQVESSERPPSEEATLATALPPAGERYTLLAEHGRGGQARILLAFDEKLGREVAIKELLPDEGGAAARSWQDAVARFRREAELTGQLVHPGVVPVFDIEQRPDGTFFYTMQLVRGRTLSEVLRDRPRLQDRLGLLNHFLNVCHVVAYAHSRGVVHRDIKPQNVMVGEFGETVLLDWGLAKQKGDLPDTMPLFQRANATAPQDATQEGIALGTPGYMSPEQANGKLAEVDERSDVYGLGAVLFEILAGLAPPKTPSTEGSSPDGKAVSWVSALSGKVPPELAAAAEKALAFRKEDRYQKASELAQDVTAFMTGGRVSAYSYTGWDLLRRFAARNRLLLGAFIMVLLFLALTSAAWRSERWSRRAAEASQQAATARGRALLEEGAKLALLQGDKLQARAKLRGALELGDSLAARALWRKLRNDSERFIANFGSPAQSVAFSPDGSQLAVGLADAGVGLVDTATRATRILRGSDDQVFGVAYSPDGALIAASSISGRIAVWDAARETPVYLGERGARIFGIAFSPDGSLLASIGSGGEIVLWDVRQQVVRARLSLAEPKGTAIAFSPDGKRLAAGGGRGKMVVFDLATSAPALTLPGPVYGVAFSPNGDLVAGGGLDGKIYLWNAASGDLSRVLGGHQASVARIAFSPNGRWLASGSTDGTVRLWSLPAGSPTRVLSARKETAYDVAFSADGSLLAAAAGTATVWDLRLSEAPEDLPPRSTAINTARFSPDGTHIATADRDGVVRLWDLSGEMRAFWTGHEASVVALCFSPDGSLVASAGLDGALMIREAQTGTLRRRIAVGDRLWAIACAPGGKRVAVGGFDNAIRIWDAATGKLVRVLEPQGAPLSRIYSLAYSADGRWLISGNQSGRMEIRDAATGRLIRTWVGHAAEVFGLALDSSGTVLASGSYDRSVRLWRFADGTGRVPGTTLTTPERVNGLAWDPLAPRVTATVSTGQILVWDLSTQEPPSSFWAHHGEANSIDFAPDGKTAVSAGDDGALRLWDTATWQPKWYTRAVVRAPEPRVLTHSGWRALVSHGQLVAAAPRATAWRRAVEASRQASMQPGGPICVVTGGGFALWEMSGDRRVLAESVETPFDLAAIPGGCSLLKDGRVTLYRPGRPPVELAAGAGFQSGGEELVVVGSEVMTFDSNGQMLRRFGSGADITAAASLGERMAVGFRDGGIELRRRRERVPVYFRDAPASAVARLGAGPSDTLIAGFESGTFGVWSLSTGEQLEVGSVHGPVRHLLVHRDTLVAASEEGSLASTDLSLLTDDYCKLLEEAWSQVPVVWRDQGAIVQPPDPGHPCRNRQ